MSPTTFAWLVLLFPLLGSIVIAVGYKVWQGRAAGWIGTAAIGLSFAASVGALVSLLDHPEEERQLSSRALGLRQRRRGSTSSSRSSSTRCRSS